MFANLKSQSATSSLDENTHGGRRKLPFAFTEQGIAMLSSVLRSEIAVQASIRIMDTFVEMRKNMSNASWLYEKMNAMEIHQIAMEEKTERRFEQVFDYIESHKQDDQKTFFDGQIFDAFSLMTDLVQQAEETIVLIDGYVDMATLNILAKKRVGVKVLIYALPNAGLTARDIQNFNAQYPVLEVKKTTSFHDRFLVIDDMTGYHIGASIKDAGKKCFGINRIEDVGVIRDLLQRAKLTSD